MRGSGTNPLPLQQFVTHFRQLHCEIVGKIRILLLYSQWPFNLPPRCQFELKYWHYQIAAVVFTSIFNDFTPGFKKTDIKHLLWHFIHSIYLPTNFIFYGIWLDVYIFHWNRNILFSYLNLLAIFMIKQFYGKRNLRVQL